MAAPPGGHQESNVFKSSIGRVHIKKRNGTGKWSNISGIEANDSLNWDGISTKSRATAVPEIVGFVIAQLMTGA